MLVEDIFEDRGDFPRQPDGFSSGSLCEALWKKINNHTSQTVHQERRMEQTTPCLATTRYAHVLTTTLTGRDVKIKIVLIVDTSDGTVCMILEGSPEVPPAEEGSEPVELGSVVSEDEEDIFGGEATRPASLGCEAGSDGLGTQEVGAERDCVSRLEQGECTRSRHLRRAKALTSSMTWLRTRSSTSCRVSSRGSEMSPATASYPLK